jgi:hypothetical protein
MYTFLVVVPLSHSKFQRLCLLQKPYRESDFTAKSLFFSVSFFAYFNSIYFDHGKERKTRVAITKQLKKRLLQHA